MEAIKNWRLFGLTARQLWAYLALTLAAAMFEGFGMASLLPVLDFVEKGQTPELLAQTSPMWKYLVQAYQTLGLVPNLVVLVVSAIGVMLIRVVLIYARQVYSGWLSQEMQHRTRSRLFEAYLAMDYGSYLRLSSGGMMNVLTTEVQRASGCFGALFALTANLTVCVGLSLVLLWLSAPLTFLAVVFLGISAVTVSRVVRHMRGDSRAATEANDRYSRLALERLNAFRLTKLTVCAKREGLRVRSASQDVAQRLTTLTRGVASVDLIMEPVVLISGGAILYLAIVVFGMTLAEVGIFVLILLRLLPLAKEVMKSRQTYLACSGSLRALLSGYAEAHGARERCAGTMRFAGVRDSIRFEAVRFVHPGANSPALDGIDLTIPAGKVTALVGPSGAGKTTLADLIPRLRTPSAGRILYDGVDGAQFEIATLRTAVGVVSQDAVILDDTVANNLRFARPGAVESELWAALEMAQAGDFVRGLDGQLNAQLGERGARLSGGQRQRLALARALLQLPEILILDEPTSALDSETERGVHEAIEKLRITGAITVVVIAHRLSTIRSADQIAVLRGGRIVEQGTHDELILSEDWYNRVSSLQGERGTAHDGAAMPRAAA